MSLNVILSLNDEGGIEGDAPIKQNSLYDQTLEEIILLNEAGNEFSKERIANGTLTPVFFGSALANFGVQTFLETYLQFAPSPQPRESTIGKIDPLIRSIFWFYL